MRLQNGCGRSVAGQIRGAFTFLEIMFVVVIIGILLGVAVTSISKRGQTARIHATRLQLKNFDTALANYELHVGRFPETREGLQALVSRPNNVHEKAWDGPYLKLDGPGLPRDPWHNAYQYRSPGQQNAEYDLWSLGPDGIEGTGDDITNWREGD
jgi:general secretion pathway protein G